MKTHTPEPWWIDRKTMTRIAGFEDRTVATTDAFRSNIEDEYTVNELNAARIVACVNACAGMEDPVAEIAALRQRIEELEAQVPKKAEQPHETKGQPKPKFESFYVDCTREEYPEVKRILEAQGYRLWLSESWSYSEDCVVVNRIGRFFPYWRNIKHEPKPTLTLAQLREKYGLTP